MPAQTNSPWLCVVGDTMVRKSSKHLHSQDPIQEEKEQKENWNAPDLLSRTPGKKINMTLNAQAMWTLLWKAPE